MLFCLTGVGLQIAKISVSSKNVRVMSQSCFHNISQQSNWCYSLETCKTINIFHGYEDRHFRSYGHCLAASQIHKAPLSDGKNDPETKKFLPVPNSDDIYFLLHTTIYLFI